MERRTFLKLFGLGTAAAGTYAVVKNWDDIKGFFSGEPYISEIPADQVFRDHDGFRVLYIEGNGKITERKFYLNKNDYYADDIEKIVKKFGSNQFKGLPSNESVKVFKDLESDERGFAAILEFKNNVGLEFARYVEIHLPTNEKLVPGLEEWGGWITVPPEKAHIKEIK